MNIFPWQIQRWKQLLELRSQGRMPHAIIVSGLVGTGVNDFVHTFANSLLCTNINQDGFACGECSSCRVKQSGAHPDYTLLGIPEGKKQIPIDNVRALNEQMTLSRSASDFRVAVISPAEAMNQYSANSLLKTLEEPSPDSVMLLMTNKFSGLLLTIRSRCVHYVLEAPTEQQSLEWLSQQNTENDPKLLLAAANNKPLTALAFDGDKAILAKKAEFAYDLMSIMQANASLVAIGEKWQKHSSEQLLVWQIHWLEAAIRAVHLKPEKLPNKLIAQLLSKRPSLDTLWQHYDLLLQMKRLTDYPLNQQSFSEHMLSLWHHYSVTPT